MNIKVARVKNSEGELVFTITVSEPSHSPHVGIDEISILASLENCKKAIQNNISTDNLMKQEVVNLIHYTKEKIFSRIVESLKFSIKNQLQPKFEPICQEIYNWIYDFQKENVRGWMSDFDPQRTRYYFDGDPQLAKQEPQQSEHDEDEDDFDDDV